MGILAPAWPVAWPGLVAPLAGFPSWFTQVGLVHPTAVSLVLAGGAVEVLLTWSGAVGARVPHSCLLVAAVLCGLLALRCLCCFGRLLGCPPSEPATVSSDAMAAPVAVGEQRCLGKTLSNERSTRDKIA